MSPYKRDLLPILGFTALGLVLAYALSGPLRHPQNNLVGTPLHAGGRPVYASGVVNVSSGLKSRVSPYPVLFLIVRPKDGGPPVAVKRFDRPSFPLDFSMGVESNMVGEDFFDGALQIVARLDADGNAGPKQPADLEGSAQVTPQSRRVKITIRGEFL